MPKIVSRKLIGNLPVYDIGLKDHHNFILENGLVASNCFNKCLAKNTGIQTPQGLKHIQDFEPGDEVYCFYKGKKLITTVIELIDSGVQEINRIEFSNGGLIRCTRHHKFVTTKSLTSRTVEDIFKDKTSIITEGVPCKPIYIAEDGIEQTYNLHVGHKVHNYLVGPYGIVSKNSHSIGYAKLTYATAYLKANYPLEFFCSLMSIRSQVLQPKLWAQKAPEYIQEAKAMGITINPPSVNSSGLEFTLGDGELFFGLNAIREIGKTAARSVCQARGKNNFTDIYDFIERVNTVKVTTRVFQALVKAGAFDKMGYQRQELLEKTQDLYDYTKNKILIQQRNSDIIIRDRERKRVGELVNNRNELRKDVKRLEKQLKKEPDNEILLTSLMVTKEDLVPLEEAKLRTPVMLKPIEEKEVLDFARSNKVELNLSQIMEQADYIGCYIGAHPAHFAKNNCQDIAGLWTGQQAKLGGAVTKVKVITTKRGQKMAFIELDDSTAIADVTIFPNTWAKLKREVELGDLIQIDCKVEQEEPIFKVIANRISFINTETI